MDGNYRIKKINQRWSDTGGDTASKKQTCGVKYWWRMCRVSRKDSEKC